MKKQLLLGKDINSQAIIFVNVEVRRDNYLAISFDVVTPWRFDDEELRRDLEDMVESSDKEWRYDKCCEYNCRPIDLVDEMFTDIMRYGNGVYEIKDCSLYPDFVVVDGEDYYFESVSCGQIDIGEEYPDFEPVHEGFYNWVYHLWKNRHMTTISKELVEEIELKLSEYEDIIDDMDGEQGIIQEWISGDF